VHVLTYLLAVLAACANATSSVLQRKANLQVPRKQNLSPQLIRSLLLTVVSGLALTAAVIVLARSPLLARGS